MNQDEYYNYIYSGRKSNETQQQRNDNKDSNTLNKQCSPNIHLVKFDKEIEFGKALELLHNELYSFKLMDDDDDNEDEN